MEKLAITCTNIVRNLMVGVCDFWGGAITRICDFYIITTKQALMPTHYEQRKKRKLEER